MGRTHAAVKAPTGGWLAYEYDATHRLTAVADALGNRIEYTLDAAGNRLEERTLDPSGTLRRSLRREYDALGRLRRELDALGHANGFDYDLDGNRVASLDPEQGFTQTRYDALDRIIETVDAAGGSTSFTYDAADRLVTVTDPNGLTTHYGYDGLGNLRQLDSPDTGVQTHAYDAAGNRIQSVDARGVVVGFAYDALNRLTGIDYPGTAYDVAFEYDADPKDEVLCGQSHPVGRLVRMVDGSGSTTWYHDARGNEVEKHQVTDGLSLSLLMEYDAADRLVLQRYPSGAEVHYLRDPIGRVIELTWRADSSAAPQLLVSVAEHLPFGPETRLDFANGHTDLRRYSTDYRLLAIDSTEPLAEATRRFSYDGLSRLTAVHDAGGTLFEGFAYDPTGNRTEASSPAGIVDYSYGTDSHRLLAVGGETRSYDAAGNTTSSGAMSLAYGPHGRLEEVGASGVPVQHNLYNGRGERVRKLRYEPYSPGGSPPAWTFLYDAAGRLVSEYKRTALNSEPQRDYVWLDDLQVAVLVHAGPYAGEALSVHVDHLGTPRMVRRDTGDVVWRWGLEGNAFGEHLPGEDPDGDSQPFTYNPRFPGQYYDQESSLHYNYFRDYEPGTGRYVESDPIGLWGGIHTFSYGDANPPRNVDRLGLAAPDPCCAIVECKVLCYGFIVYPTVFCNRTEVDCTGKASTDTTMYHWNQHQRNWAFVVKFECDEFDEIVDKFVLIYGPEA